MPWTQDQTRAIESRGANLLVAAAAGSGKTSVMVERILRLVNEGANIDDMLVVTFTRAASADMRAKLRAKLAERALAGDARAREQMERLETAGISTLHSFCTELLRQNFEAAGVDPMFRVLDDAEDAQLTEKALDEALERAYAAGGAAMDALDFARGPEKVKALALSMYRFLRERPDPEGWFARARELNAGDGGLWAGVLCREAQTKLGEAEALNAYGVARAGAEPGLPQYADAMREDGQVLRAYLALDYAGLCAALPEYKPITPARARRDKSEAGEGQYNEVTGVRARVKKLAEGAQKLVSLDINAALSDVRANACALDKLYEIARDLDARVSRARAEKNALTFSDLEHFTLKALSDPRAAERVRKRFSYVFVDEYQDTSDVQEAILARVAGERNLFMVGDVKQSIYRFREAEPKLFLAKYESFRQGGENERIVLKQNFRSRESVLAFVNHVFSRVMHGGASEITYDADARLYPGRAFQGEDPAVELHIMDKASGADADAPEDEDAETLTDAEREGVIIARRIRALLAEDPALSYRDICVLTRVRVNAIQYLAGVLSREGIPAYADASESYFDALEVMETLCALRLIVNPRRDVDLICALRSPLFAFSTSELAEIRADARADSFYEALILAAETRGKVAAFFETLGAWRALSRAMPLQTLIRRVLADTRFYAYVGALPGGKQRQANLDALCQRAAAYENGAGGSLSEFLAYAAGMRARGDGDGAHVLGENDNVVRLMTAHKSKGLEFPVVFAALLGRKYRASRAEDALYAHRDLGAALMRVDAKLQTRRDTLSRRAIASQQAAEARAEELRILYVMLTRAKERLILTGACRDFQTDLARWQIASGFPDLYACNLDIVAAAACGCPGARALGGETRKGYPAVETFVYGAQSLSPRAGAQAEDARQKTALLDAAMAGEGYNEAVRQAIAWRYPNPERVFAPVKLTVTGLSREIAGAAHAPDIAQRPAFLSGGALSPAERGSAVHAALRHLSYAPFDALSEKDAPPELARQIADMRARGLLSAREAAAVRADALARFLYSPMGARLRAAREVRREWRFCLRMPVREAVPDAPGDGEMLVQGSVDCCFLEDGGWVLLDYKTDHGENADALVARYAPQVRLYAKALARITALPVKECALCLLYAGENAKVE